MATKDTHLTYLYVAEKPSSISHVLSAGQSEFDGTLYADGGITASGAVALTSTLSCSAAVTFTSTLAVTSTLSAAATTVTTLTATSTASVAGLLTATSGISIGDFITAGSRVYGTSSFTEGATSDTLTISGLLATDRVMVQPYGGSVSEHDVLMTSSTTDTCYVYRPNTSGTTSLAYFYFILRPA